MSSESKETAFDLTPSVSKESNKSTVGEILPANGRFRWRIIPTMLLYFYGGILSIILLFGLGCHLMSFFGMQEPSSALIQYPFQMMFAMIVLLATHLCAIFIAARSLWKGRCFKCITAIVVAAIMFIAARLLCDVPFVIEHPPGNRCVDGGDALEKRETGDRGLGCFPAASRRTRRT